MTASDLTVARTPRPPSTAVRLLKKLVATRWFELDAIARALGVSDARLAAYLSESEAIPLDRQLCLALFVIECVPPLARVGHQLRGQVKATMAFQARATDIHLEPPPGDFRRAR
jgi:hypothetical protein